LRRVGRALDLLILVAFVAEFAWMLHLVRRRWHYVAFNWLDLLIIIASVASLAGHDTEWVALGRLARVTMVGLMLVRFLGSLRTLYSPDALPFLFGVAVVTLLLGGAGFYLLEPTVHSYADGLWLAFVTGATVGFGDLVPTTTASRLWAALMVVSGFAMLSLLTATMVTLFLGEDEAKLRREMHNDIRMLRDEVRALRGALGLDQAGRIARSPQAPGGEHGRADDRTDDGADERH
jgi:voltage-gated potassium channel